MGKLYTADNFVTIGGTAAQILAADGSVITAGTNITISGGVISSTGGTSYTLPTATSTVLGGVKLFSDTVQSTIANAVSATASRTYGVQVNAAEQMLVNVPWTDTVYTHPAYTAINIDTSGAQVIDIITSDAIGSVTNITTRTMTLGDLGYTGATNANYYVLPFTDNSANWNTAYSWGNHAGLYASSSHTHTFDSLTAKTSGTGTYQTTGEFIQNNGKYVRDSYYRTISGRSDLYSGGSEGWYTAAQVTLTSNCSGAVLYGTLNDHRYNGADSYQIAVVARAECDFDTNNQSHYVNVGCTILGSTNYTNYRSKIRVVLTTSTTNNRTYQLQFFETAWNNDTWQLETNGWTIYNSPQTASAEVGTPLVNYVSNQNADYQRANTASYSPVFYDTDDTAYYLNPNSTSNLNALNLAGDLSFGSQTSTWITSNAMSDSIGWNSSYGVYIGSNTLGYSSYIRGNGTFTNNTGTHNLLHADNYTTYTDPRLYRGYSTSGDFQTLQSTSGTVRFDQIGPTGSWSNAPGGYTYGGALSLRGDNFGFQLWGSHTGNFYFKTQWDNDQYSGWREVLHSANYTSFAAAAVHTHTFDSLTSKSSGTGVYQTSGDFRAPIFYDSDNTSYYLDPTSTTQINNLRLSTLDSAITWTNSTYMMGSPTHGFRFNDNASSINALIIDNSGNSIAYASHRAPIFYDTNNTGFYIDPTGTSNISKAYHTGNIVATNFGYGQIGLYSSVRYQAVFSMGEAYVLPVDGTTSGNLYGMAWSHPNAGGVAGNLNTHGLLVMENGTFLAAISGSIRSRDDMRAPIFYDSNNTSYYCDPASTSNLSGLLVGGLNVIKTSQTISGNIDSDYGEGFVTFDPIPSGTPPLASPNIRTINVGDDFNRRTQLAFNYSSDQAWFRRKLDGSFYTWREFIHSGNIGSQSVSYATTAGTASSAGSVDWSNIASKTAWMTTTSLIASHNNANDWRNSGFYENDGGGSNWPSSTWYNSINVRHSNQGNYHGFQMAMSYYDNNLWFRSYNGAGTFQAWETAIGSGGSNQSKTGFFQSNDSLRAPIFYDSNNTAYYINPADTTTSANFQSKINIDASAVGDKVGLQITNGYGNPSIGAYYSSMYTSLSFYAGHPTGTAYDVFGNSARFNIFYERNNTAYYIDPATTSVLNTLNMSFNNNSYGSALNVTNSNTGSQAIAGLSMSAGGKFGSINMFATGYMDLLNQDTTNGGIQFRPRSAVSMYIDNISSTSRVTIGTGNTASHPLRVTQQVSNVSIYADYDIVAYSDQSVKENIRPIENVLERINNSRGVLYDRTDSGEKNNIGFIAQELEVEFPELVVTNEDNTKAVKYQNAVAVLFEAVKEQQKQIEELKELVNKLITK